MHFLKIKIMLWTTLIKKLMDGKVLFSLRMKIYKINKLGCRLY